MGITVESSGPSNAHLSETSQHTKVELELKKKQKKIVLQGNKICKGDLSITSLHEKVELALNEKHKKIALHRGGYIRSPKEPAIHACKSPKGPWHSFASFSKSHPLTTTCVFWTIVTSILIIIIM